MQNLIWLASYPKSGNTWVRAFLTAYLSDARVSVDLKRIDDCTASESYVKDFVAVSGKARKELTAHDIDTLREPVQRWLASARRKFLVKTHNARIAKNGYPLIRSEYTRQAVYVVRNPFDIVDSLADHNNLSLDGAMALLNDPQHCLSAPNSKLVPQYLGTWSQHAASWIGHQEFPVLVLRYEDLQAAPRDVFGKLIKFLGWEYDEDRLEHAVKASSIQSLQDAEARQGFAERSDVARSGRFFRRGESDRWRHVLTRLQAETVVAHHAEMMQAVGYAIPDLDKVYPMQPTVSSVPTAQSTGGRVFDDGWRRWIAENLMLACPSEKILATLIQSGFNSDEARREIANATNSPYLKGATRLVNRLKKREWVLEIHRRLNRILPGGDTVERRARLPRDVFLRDYYTTNRPVVITGMLDDWPALRKWNPAYLRERFGDRIVEVQTHRNENRRYEVESQKHRTLMPLAEYVDRIVAAGETNDYYMTANNNSRNFEALRELWDDIVQIPEYLDEMSDRRGFFWFGPAGTITPLHHDLTNNFMAQVHGRKLVKLIPSCDLPNMYNQFHCYTDVDAGAPDLVRFPDYARVRVIDCEIGPGDLLFLPVGWWHYVRGLDISITVTFTNFALDNDFHSLYTTYHEVYIGGRAAEIGVSASIHEAGLPLIPAQQRTPASPRGRGSEIRGIAAVATFSQSSSLATEWRSRESPPALRCCSHCSGKLDRQQLRRRCRRCPLFFAPRRRVLSAVPLRSA